MTIDDIFRVCREAGVAFKVDGEDLRIRAESGSVPTGLLNCIKKHKAEIITRLIEPDNPCDIARHEEQKWYPLTGAQTEIFLYDELFTASAANNVSLAVSVNLELDAARLEHIVLTLVKRHKSLRTSYEKRPQGIRQKIVTVDEFSLDITDMTENNSQHAIADARAVLLEYAARPFALATDLKVRVLLVRLANRKSILLVVHHHIACDQHSIAIFTQELLQLYQGNGLDERDDDGNDKYDYVDFVNWLSCAPQQRQRRLSLEYWRENLDGAPPCHGIYLDNPRRACPNPEGGMVIRCLSPELLMSARSLCRANKMTLYALLFSVFAVLVGKWSRSEEVVIGSPISGRVRKEWENVLGLFVRVLPFRFDLARDLTVEEALALHNRTISAGLGHQDVSLPDIIEFIDPPRSENTSPLFQLVFDFAVNGISASGTSEFEIEPVDLSLPSAKFEVTLSAIETEGQVSFTWEFRKDLLHAETIESMADAYLVLLNQFLTRPWARLSELKLVDQSHEKQLVTCYQARVTKACAGRSIAEEFKSIVADNRERVALRYASKVVTYGELDVLSNQLANYFLGRKLGVGAKVGVLLRPSVNAIVSILACTKSGATYVPMDTTQRDSYSNQRRTEGVDGLITDDNSLVGINVDMGTCINLDEEAVRSAVSSQLGDCVMGRRAKSDDIACIFYTSGSSGRPKGVQLSHENIVSLVRGGDVLQARPTDVVAHVSNLAFDASTFEVWGALLNGAEHVRIDRAALLNPGQLKAFVSEHGITKILLTTSLFNEIASECPSCLSGIRDVMFGGEAASRYAVRKMVCAGKPEHLVNLYGPTENTTIATLYEVPDDWLETDGVPIGTAAHDCGCWVMDEAASVVPVGCVGELCLSGRGLSMGYLDNSGNSNSSFVDHPLLAKEKMYRTGDLVRMRRNGNLDYIGREDRQVKIRGHRIELEAIEQELRSLAGVKEAVAVLSTRSGGDKAIAAYVVSRDGSSPDTAKIQDILRQNLPSYMVPASIVAVDKVQLTTNGKIDLQALSAPSAHTKTISEPPCNAVEEKLCAIFKDVLSFERIGRTDSIFECGGHSLSILRICSRIKETFGIELGAPEVFANPRVNALASSISGRLNETSTAAKLRPAPSAEDYPISSAQRRLWFEYLSKSDTRYNLPVAIRMRGSIDTLALSDALREIVQRHTILRTIYFELKGEVRQQIVSTPAEVLKVHDYRRLGREAGNSKALSTIDELGRSKFDLEREMSFSSRLFLLDDMECILFLLFHHIAVDGWSLELIVGEIVQLYLRRTKNDHHASLDIPLQYKDYAYWQGQPRELEQRHRSLNYWQAKLADIEAIHYPGIQYAEPTSKAAVLESNLIEGEWEMFERYRRSRRVSTFTIVLGVFSIVLSVLQGRRIVVIGTDAAGRNDIALEKIVGFFVNQVALVVNAEPRQSFGAFLISVQKELTESLDHSDLPFDDVVARLARDRKEPVDWLLQTKLVFDAEIFASIRQLDDVELEFLPPTTRESKVDLMLTVSERNGNLLGAWEYNSSKFGSATIERLSAQFKMALLAVMENSDILLAEIENAFNEQQRSQLAKKRVKVNRCKPG
jgi:amino acid adenylation domain-containing protein